MFASVMGEYEVCVLDVSGVLLSRSPEEDIQMEGKNVLRVGKMKKLEKTRKRSFSIRVE